MPVTRSERKSLGPKEGVKTGPSGIREVLTTLPGLMGRWLVRAAALAGCGGVPFLVPDTRGPADLARGLEPRCAGFTEESVAPMLSSTIVDSVEPAYSYVKSGPNDHE